MVKDNSKTKSNQIRVHCHSLKAHQQAKLCLPILFQQ